MLKGTLSSLPQRSTVAHLSTASRRNTSTATATISEYPEPSEPAFVIRKERPGHADIITFHQPRIGHSNRIHADLLPDVENIYRNKIDELFLTLDTMGTPEAYQVLRRIPSNVKVVGGKKMGALQKIVERMMADVLAKTPGVKGMPSPNDLIKRAIGLGLYVGRLHDMVFVHMVEREENPGNVLAYFIPAVKHRIAVPGKTELPPIGEGVNPFRTVENFPIDGRALYVAYLYLHLRGFKGRDIIAEIDEQLHTLNLPSVDKITNQLPNQELGKKLFKLSIELPLERIVNDGAALYKRVRQTIERNNPEALTKLYYAARTLCPPTEEFYVIFLRGFRQLWRSESAVRAIWKDMIDSGIKPTEDAYMALIPMAADSKSLTILDEIWEEMKKAGITLTARAWTQRVDVAFHRSIDEGKATLNEMIMDNAIKPTNVTINVAINHFIKYKEYRTATEMMEYAAKQGLQPEITIYNMLLGQVLSIRPLRNIDAAVRILKMMEQTHVEPDHVTFTTLVNGIKGYESDTGDNEKSDDENVGMYIFNLMKKVGLQPNTFTYGALLDYLMSLRPRPLATIRNLFDEMQASRVLPNSTIYDIVIRSAFAMNDIQAVNYYWEEMKRNSIERDAKIWETMMIHFAVRNDYPRIVKLMTELERANKSMQADRAKVVLTLKAYNDAVQALNKRNSKVEARDMIEAVVAEWGWRIANISNTGRTVEQWWRTVGRVGGYQYAVEMLEKANQHAEECGIETKKW